MVIIVENEVKEEKVVEEMVESVGDADEVINEVEEEVL